MSSHLCRIMISDREYKSWRLVDPDTYSPLTHSLQDEIRPLDLKWLTNDLIDLSTNPPTLIHSPVRSSQIPAILVLEGNKTYGRTKNKKRLLYKCIPNDRFLPAFLVPYLPEIGFSKIMQNRFVVFQFDHWNETHPHGMLTENLGEVSNLNAFYEYQLFCRSLHDSISDFGKVAKKVIQNNENGTEFIGGAIAASPRIFSIDPLGASDQDDAFSIEKSSSTTYIVRVYIANVYLCLEKLGIWKSFSRRVSTIYLPDFKRPMLPTILSEHTCSLTECKTRHAFCMEVEVDITTRSIVPDKTTFYNTVIQVHKNYAYESLELKVDPHYQLLLECTKMLDSGVIDSADVVSHWMIQTNGICGEMMQSRGVGIFRQASWHPTSEEPKTMEATLSFLPSTLTSQTKRLIANWRHATGQYATFNKDHPIEHATMRKEAYIHITSPIRRIVDLLNQIVFQCEFGLVKEISSDARDFVEHWTGQLDYINTTMRSIKKIQLDCDMIHRCSQHPEWSEKTHLGVVFDRINRTDGMYSYMVHLQELNMLGRLTTKDYYENYTVLPIRIFVFHDEERLHRKVRLTSGLP